MKLLLIIVFTIMPFNFTAAAIPPELQQELKISLNKCFSNEGRWAQLQHNTETLEICFFGAYAIDPRSLELFRESQTTTEAIIAYRAGKGSLSRGGVCGSYDAELIETKIETKDDNKNENEQNLKICKFSDASYIEETTLWMGPDSIESTGLNHTLKRNRKALSTGRNSHQISGENSDVNPLEQSKAPGRGLN